MESGTSRTTRLIVLDASVVVSAALRPSSIPRQAFDRARETGRLALSRPVADEIRQVLARRKFSSILTPARQDDIMTLLCATALWFSPAISVGDCRDPNDNKYLELALAAAASVLVTSDRDLLTLDPWRGIRIVRPAEFLWL